MTTNLYDQLSGDQAPLATPERVLTIGAHPDDAEFGAGATLARWAEAGAEITMVVVTDGSKGSWDEATDPEALSTLRIEEQARAADALGVASVVHLGHVDGELEYSMDLRREFAELIRDFRPDVVLSHDPWQRYQMHPDHRATGLAACDAIVDAREPLARSAQGLPSHRPAAALLWSADEPDHPEPVSPEWFDRKVIALMCHSSQSGTTMGGAASGAEERLRFVDKLAAWHGANGNKFGIGPAEVFKLIIP